METLPRAARILPAGSWPAAEARDRITLDYDDRHRRRRRFTGQGGTAFLLDLAEAAVLREGDGLALDTGGIIAVQAAPEPLTEIRAQSPGHLMRLAWHLGNRHLPTEIQPGRLLIRYDHVIVEMLLGLGATVSRVEEPFNPEGGAYGEHNRQPAHHHAHAHAHDHAHEHHEHSDHAADGHGHHHGDGHHHHHG
jgi:urease accessory protein